MAHNKKFAYEYAKQVSRTRIPAKPEEKLDSKINFGPHEESDYLSGMLGDIPYGTYMTDDQNMFDAMRQSGYVFDGVLYRHIFAYWKERKGRAWLVPADTDLSSQEDVGLHTAMSAVGDFSKTGKYVNRVLSPHAKDPLTGESLVVWGDEDSYEAETDLAFIQVEPHDDLTADDCYLTVKYMDLKAFDADQKALVDGFIGLSAKAVRACGLATRRVAGDVCVTEQPRLGQAWRLTIGTPRGLGKGHSAFVPGLDYDIVIYGPKKILKTKRFFFASMGELHVGKPHTDRQSCVNFQFHKNRLLIRLAKTFMHEVNAFSKDPGGLRRFVLNYTIDPGKELIDTVDPRYDFEIERGDHEWLLRKAMRYGISHLRFPGVWRRISEYLVGDKSPVFQCYNNLRVPMAGDTYHIADYGYVMPDLNCIGPLGEVDPSKGIGEGEIVFPDLDPGTKVICYRQPSENSNAWVELIVVDKPEFRPFVGRGICMLGQGAKRVLARLGGGDMDDQFVIVSHPEWVAHFKNITRYPETEKAGERQLSSEDLALFDSPEAITEMQDFTNQLMEEINESRFSVYSDRHVDWQIEMANNSRAGIGPVVNYGLIDLLLSDPEHKASMLKDLGKSEEADWLVNREGYQAAFLMTNLEKVIDSAVKDISEAAVLGDVGGQIRKFHMGCRVYPESQRTRIPEYKREEGDYVLAKSLLCRALDEIEEMRQRLVDSFREREWDMVVPADRELLIDYPYDDDQQTLIRGKFLRDRDTGAYEPVHTEPSVMDIWYQHWREAFSQGQPPKESYQTVVDKLTKYLADKDNETMRQLAVRMYFETYKRTYVSAQYDPAGRAMGYRDALLWSPVFDDHFINALRRSKHAGYYVSATLLPEYASLLNLVAAGVEVRGNVVYAMDTFGKWTKGVGVVEYPCPDGRYVMDRGVIEVRAGKSLVAPQRLDPKMYYVYLFLPKLSVVKAQLEKEKQAKKQ